MQKIKSVVFDWGGVLIKNPVKDFLEECSKRIGLEAQNLKEAYREFSPSFERGILTESNLWKRISDKLNINIPNSYSLWNSCFKKVYNPYKNVIELASHLHKNGYKIALLSNTEVPAMDYFHELNYDFFDETVFSCAEGFVKPDLQIYRILIKKLNLLPENIVFIDDKKENVQSAQQLGMNALVFRNYDQLITDLKKASVII